MSVTNDVSVMKNMDRVKARSSKLIAKKMGLTVFQITARLKSMESRSLIKRSSSGKWLLVRGWQEVEKEQAAAASFKVAKRKAAASGESGPRKVSDRGVPRIDTRGWQMTEIPARRTPVRTDDYVKIFTSPKTGKSYVYANPNERARYIRRMPVGLRDIRLVELTPSHPVSRLLRQYMDSLAEEGDES